MVKKCIICGIDFETNQPKKKTCSKECKKKRILDYGRKRYRDNKEDFSIRWKKYYIENKSDIKKQRKEHSKKLKQEIINHYGDGKCACCGEDRIEFLTIDHENGDGGEFRRNSNGKNGESGSLAGNNFYGWLKKRGFPDDLGLRILCFNCNCSIGAYGYCPHQKEG